MDRKEGVSPDETLEGPEPFYSQIAGIMRRRIEDGTYPVDRLVPSESAICDEFNVSRRTARSAYALLREQGWVVSSPGKGTYARKPPE